MKHIGLLKFLQELLAQRKIIDNDLNKLFNLRSIQGTSSPSLIVQQFKDLAFSIDEILNKIESKYHFSNDDIILAVKIGIDFLLTPKRPNYINEAVSELSNNPSVVKEATRKFYIDFSNILDKITIAESILQNLFINSYQLFDNNHGIIELVFDGEVSIEDFSDAKEQMNNWYIIVDGYARLLGIAKEDFQIVSISKASPTRYSLKATLPVIVLFLTMTEKLLSIEKTLIDRRAMISRITDTPMVSDKSLQEQYTKMAIEQNEKIANEKIEEIVDKKIEEHNLKENKEEIKTHLYKSIQYQHNFIVHGGTVNVYVQPGHVQQEIAAFDTAKKAYIEATEAAKNIVQLSPPREDSLLQEGKEKE